MTLRKTSPREFASVSLRLASPEKIRGWSHGEVTKAETINYRTQRSEKNGLFDERIFGPERDYECYCGKYRGIRYKGIECEKCGVEVTRSIVRRERMGHIELAAPVAHVWFLRSIPSRMATLLGVKSTDLEKVIYFAAYIVKKVDEDKRKELLSELDEEFKKKVAVLKKDEDKDKLKSQFQDIKKEIENIHEGDIYEDSEYARLSMKYSSLFEAGVGAEAIYEIFQKLDLEKIIKELEKKQEDAPKSRRRKIIKRLSLARQMYEADINPEHMFLKVLPVMPPALRPMVALEGGRHATSDVNDLYRRVINRNNRLKRLIAINAPHVILRNEKRILQEAVDALVDNSIRRGSSYAYSSSQRRALKSLADNLKSKQGIFRQNLLGKRVDYSGRSVIVIGPDLKVDQCGIPKHMALELFKPFVIARLLETETAYNIRGANKLIDEGAPEVWEILEDVTQDRYVLLNRAPTLHRLGIQAFRPLLIEGDAIQLHPLVCTAFNADFDGDQMAVHVPLSEEAQLEAREIMAANRNVIKPGTGKPVLAAKLLDIILGCFWMTKIVDGKPGEGNYYASPNDAINAYDHGVIDIRAKINVLSTDTEKYAEFEGGTFETSVGRLLFNSVLPSDYRYINKQVDKPAMQGIVDELIEKYGIKNIPDILDDIKHFGFKYATYAGITWGLDDIAEPEAKQAILDEAQAEADEVEENYQNGFLTERERNVQIIEIWMEAKQKIEAAIEEDLDPMGSVYDLWRSGARGSLKQITVMAGMKGNITNNKNEIIPFPIKTSSKQGHSPIEYFITTHGSRKGLTDTALNTAKAGYLTRRLFDVSQDVVVTEEACGTEAHFVARQETLGGIEISLAKVITGRYAADTVKDDEGNIIARRNDLIYPEKAREIEEAGIEEVKIYSPMNCEAGRGVCQRCYGVDLTTTDVVEMGEPVGTVAAQAIGEPGTQLTMRTFHAGGVASKEGDITAGLPRVEQIFECRTPKIPAVLSKTGGKVVEVEEQKEGYTLKVAPNLEDRKSKKSKDELVSYKIHPNRTMLVEEGDEVKKGQFLTDGAADLEQLFKLAGKQVAQRYIIKEITKIYELQGASISRKHVEVLIGQMFSRVRITDAGDSDFTVKDIVEKPDFRRVNRELEEAGKEPAKAKQLIVGITEVALTRQSWLSAASFQHTTRTLISAALRGAEDKLRGLKENVMIGRLIPAGSGFPGSPKHEMIAQLQEEKEQE